MHAVQGGAPIVGEVQISMHSIPCTCVHLKCISWLAMRQTRLVTGFSYMSNPALQV